MKTENFPSKIFVKKNETAEKISAVVTDSQIGYDNQGYWVKEIENEKYIYAKKPWYTYENITTGKINAKYIELPGIEIGSDTVASIHAGQLFTSYFNCSGFAEIGSLAVGSYNVVDELEYLQQQIDELKEKLSE